MRLVEFVGFVAGFGFLCSTILFIAGYLQVLIRNSWFEPNALIGWGAKLALASMLIVLVGIVIAPLDFGVRRSDAAGQIVLMIVLIIAAVLFRKWRARNEDGTGSSYGVPMVYTSSVNKLDSWIDLAIRQVLLHTRRSGAIHTAIIARYRRTLPRMSPAH